MLDDYKYSVGRLVVYNHPEPKLPRQSYGHHGHERTVGEVLAVDVDPNPSPHWVYAIRNVRNQEIAHIDQDQIKFATAVGRYWKKSQRRAVGCRVEDGVLAEMIAKALSNPDRASLLRSTLRDMLRREELEARARTEGPNLPLAVGDYVRLRGDMREEMRELHNHYAKILSVEPAGIAGIENALGQPTLYRTLKKFKVVTSEGTQGEVYDAEIKLFYTANGRKVILNWRAASLLAEAFGDEKPYNVEYDYLAEHVFTRDELKAKSRSELAQILASLLYVKGRLGWRDYQRRNHYFAGTPKSHLLDSILEFSRFDSRRNRVMTPDEVADRHKEYFKLRRMLKGG